MTLVVAGIFHRFSISKTPEVLLFQRAANDTGAGLYEFPGGKVEVGESEKQALVRELEEEIAIKVSVQEKLGSTEFQAPNGRKFKLIVYFVNGNTEQIRLLEHQHMKWVNRSTFSLDEIMIGDRPLMTMCFDQLDQIYSKN